MPNTSITKIKTENVGTSETIYECTGLNVSLGDGSEEMLYNGQLMIYNNKENTKAKVDKDKIKTFSKHAQQRKREKEKFYRAQGMQKQTWKTAEDVPWSTLNFQLPNSTLQEKVTTAPVSSLNESSPSCTLSHCTSNSINDETCPSSVTTATNIPFVFSTTSSVLKSYTFASLEQSKPTLTFSTTNPISSVTAYSANEVKNGACMPFSFGVPSRIIKKPTLRSKTSTAASNSTLQSTSNNKINENSFKSKAGIPSKKSEFLGDVLSSKDSVKPTNLLGAVHVEKCAIQKNSGPNDASNPEEFPSLTDASSEDIKPKEKLTAVNEEKPAADHPEDEIGVSEDSSICAAVNGLKAFIGNDSAIKQSSSNMDMTTIELFHNLYQSKQHCYFIQSSLVKALISELRKLDDNLKFEENDHSSSESLTELHKSLVILLTGLLKCLDIQLGLNHGMRVLFGGASNSLGDYFDYSSSEEDLSLNVEDLEHIDLEAKDDQLIESRSLMNRTSFVKAFVCVHLVNPYSSDLRYSCGADHVHRFLQFRYYLPHGTGRLESLTGDLIYEGQWKKGKRWGFGKAFIFSGQELSASKNQYGMYQGYWWNNMRHGHGRLVFASSAEYNGEWQYDLMSGVGTMKYPGGSSFEGIWDEDVPDGCGMYTWPNGTVECREYGKGQVLRILQLPENTWKKSSHNEVARDYSILRLKYQTLYEEKASLFHIYSKLKDTLEKRTSEMNASQKQLRNTHEEKIKDLKTEFRKLLHSEKTKIKEKHEVEQQKLRESFESEFKELEDKATQARQDLERKESAFLCQICFEHQRDCMIMPCTHMLYCRRCIAKVKTESNRCPACRGNINGEINCNTNL